MQKDIDPRIGYIKIGYKNVFNVSLKRKQYIIF